MRGISIMSNFNIENFLSKPLTKPVAHGFYEAVEITATCLQVETVNDTQRLRLDIELDVDGRPFKKCFFNKGVEIALEQLMRQLDAEAMRPDELVAYLIGKAVNITIYDHTWYDAAVGVERHEKAVAFTSTEYKPNNAADTAAMI
jgi:hypothetical protein